MHKYRSESVSNLKHAIADLRPNLNIRTLINAYVVPSLHDLELYDGTLASGSLTRYGFEIATIAVNSVEKSNDLIAKHLVTIDEEKVGFIREFLKSDINGVLSRAQSCTWFIRTIMQSSDNEYAQCMDRLGKWLAYLVHFGVARDDEGKITLDKRHIDALFQEEVNVPDEEIKTLVVDSYLLASSRIGTRYYIPIPLLRDIIGAAFKKKGISLTDRLIDKILIRSVSLLDKYIVSFSPFSGPAKYGLKLPSMFAGFITIRPKPQNPQ